MKYELRTLDDKYQGSSFDFNYVTNKYYDVIATDMSLGLIEKTFSQPQAKHFTSTLFDQWLEEPLGFGLFDNNQLIAFVEGTKESWHNVFRITNLLVTAEYRHQGLGVQLMKHIMNVVHTKNYRAIILETQSCNYPAIQLYKKLGFQLSRIDIAEYSNNDIENKEVRLDFIYYVSNDNLNQ